MSPASQQTISSKSTTLYVTEALKAQSVIRCLVISVSLDSSKMYSVSKQFATDTDKKQAVTSRPQALYHDFCYNGIHALVSS